MTNRTPKNEVTVKQLKNALRTVALYFNEPYTKADGEEGNRLGRPQEALLNGMCWKAQREIERLETEYLPKAADELAWLVRRYGSPHSVDERIAGKQLWIQTLEDQLFALKEFLAAAEDVHYDATGKVYGKAVAKMNDAAVDPTSADMIRRYARNKSTANDTRNSPGIESPAKDTAAH